MSKLIACVAIALMVDGQRQEFAAGAELPELSAHDAAELKKSGAIKDQDEEAAAEKAAARTAKQEAAAFERARQDVAAQLESIANQETVTKAETKAKPKAAGKA